MTPSTSSLFFLHTRLDFFSTSEVGRKKVALRFSDNNAQQSLTHKAEAPWGKKLVHNMDSFAEKRKCYMKHATRHREKLLFSHEWGDEEEDSLDFAIFCGEILILISSFRLLRRMFLWLGKLTSFAFIAERLSTQKRWLNSLERHQIDNFLDHNNSPFHRRVDSVKVNKRVIRHSA